MKKYAILILLVALPALLFAQQKVDPGAPWGDTVRLTNLVNHPVTSDSGDFQDATLQDLVINPNGEVAFLVVGQGGTSYLVPQDKMTGYSDNGIKLNLTQNDLQGLQTAQDLGLQVSQAAGAQTGMNQPAAGGQTGPEQQPQVAQQPGAEPETAETAPAPGEEKGEVAQQPGAQAPVPAADSVMLASNLIGWSFTDLTGNELGVIEDVVVDLAQGWVEYVAVSPESVLGVADRYYAIPPQLWAGFQPVQKALRSELTSSLALTRDPGFPPQGEWPTSGTTEDFETGPSDDTGTQGSPAPAPGSGTGG